MQEIIFTLAVVCLCLYAISIMTKSFNQIAKGNIASNMINAFSNSYLTNFYSFIFCAFTGETISYFGVLGSLLTHQIVSQSTAYSALAWGYVATNMGNYLITLNIKTLVNLLIIITSLFAITNKSEKWRYPINALFGISLLLFGLQLIQSKENPSNGMEFIHDFLHHSENSYFSPILLGLILRFFGNSMILITLGGAIILKMSDMNYQQFILFVCGNSLEVIIILSISIIFFKNYYKRLITVPIIQNLILFIFFFTVVFLERKVFHQPIVSQYLKFLGDRPEVISANFLLIYALIGLVIMLVLKPTIINFWNQYMIIKKLVKPDEPYYINDFTFISQENAFESINKEQIRLAEKFNYYFSYIRNYEKINEENILNNNYNFCKIDESCNEYIKKLSRESEKIEFTETVFHYATIQKNLELLNSLIFKYSLNALRSIKSYPQLTLVILNFSEALDLIALELIDLMKNPTHEYYNEYFGRIKRKSDIVDEIRQKYLIEDTNFTKLDKNHVFDLTLLFEHIEWVFNQLADTIAHPTELQNQLTLVRERWKKSIQ